MAPESLEGFYQRHRQWRTTNLGKCRLGPTVWDARGTHRAGRYAGPGRPSALSGPLFGYVDAAHQRTIERIGPLTRHSWSTKYLTLESSAGVASPGRHVWGFGATCRTDCLPPRHDEWLRLAGEPIRSYAPANSCFQVVLEAARRLRAWHGRCHGAVGAPECWIKGDSLGEVDDGLIQLADLGVAKPLLW